MCLFHCLASTLHHSFRVSVSLLSETLPTNLSNSAKNSALSDSCAPFTDVSGYAPADRPALVPSSDTYAVEADSSLLFIRRFGNTRDRFLAEQNHLSYRKLHLRKRLVVLMLLKTSKLVSKFENSTQGSESRRSNEENSWTITEGAPLAARC